MTMPEAENLYEILQLHPSAHPDIIRASYLRLTELYDSEINQDPEATLALIRINRAYQVLSDPEQRAEYDRELQRLSDPSTPPPAKPTDAPSPQRGRRRNSAPDYFTLGSTKAQVAKVQGPPDSTYSNESFEGETWNYPVGIDGQSNSIRFDRRGRVEGWFNRGGLKARLEPGPNATSVQLFAIGSHKDDVARLQGTPDSIRSPSRYTQAEIRSQRQEARQEAREIAKILGEKYEPKSEIEDSLDSNWEKRETWTYPDGTVEFALATGRVTAWADDGIAFNVERQPASFDEGWPGPDFFTLGSTMEEVRKVQGNPVDTSGGYSSIRNPYTWKYGDILEYVEFEYSSKKVQGWQNRYGRLKVKAIPGTTVATDPEFSLGSDEAHVIRLHGTPKSIVVSSTYDDEEWTYSGGSVVFQSSTGRVIYWENPQGRLKVRGIRPEGRIQRTPRERKENQGKTGGESSGLGCLGIVAGGVIILPIILGAIII